MKIIKPHTIGETMLVSSTAVETAPALYNPATNYAAGVQVSVAGTLGVISVYQSLQAANTGNTPATSPLWWKWINDTYQEYNPATNYAAGARVQVAATHKVYQSVIAGNVGQAVTDTTKWLFVGPTNKWAAFDDSIGTRTITSSPLVMVIDVPSTDGFGALELMGRNFKLTGTDGPAGPIVYVREFSLDGSQIDSFFDWFYADYEQLTDVALLDLPAQYNNMRLTIEITSTVGTVGVGVARPGKITDVGVTQKGASVGILDFSKKERDPIFGTITTVERGFSKRGSFEVLTEAFAFNRIFKRLASFRAVPCFYVGSETLGFEPLLIYGFYRDFSIAVQYDIHHLCSLEIEGITND